MLNKSSSVTDIYPSHFLWAIQSAHLPETPSLPVKGKASSILWKCTPENYCAMSSLKWWLIHSNLPWVVWVYLSQWCDKTLILCCLLADFVSLGAWFWLMLYFFALLFLGQRNMHLWMRRLTMGFILPKISERYIPGTTPQNSVPVSVPLQAPEKLTFISSRKAICVSQMIYNFHKRNL